MILKPELPKDFSTGLPEEPSLASTPATADATTEVPGQTASLAAEMHSAGTEFSGTFLSKDFLKLDPRQIQADVMGSLIFSVIVAIAALVGVGFAWFQLGFTWIFYLILAGATIAVILLFVAALLWPRLEFSRTSYRIDEEGFEIRRGVFWRRSITVPLGRVQHADVSQGPVQRMYGISTLTVHTAGTHNASVQLDGLEYQYAVSLRDFIVHQRKERDAV